MIRLAIVLALFASPSAAQMITCGPHAELTASLAAAHGETRVAIGLDARGIVIETYGNTATGTWSLLTVTPDLVACIVASGQMLQLTIAPEGEPS